MAKRVDSRIIGAVFLSVATATAGAQAAPARTLVEEFRIDGVDNKINRIVNLAVAPNGNVFVAHDGPNALTVFSPDGRAIRTVGPRGSGRGQVSDRLAGMGVVGDSLWVADRGLNRLLLFGSDGTLGRMIAFKGNADWMKKRPGEKEVFDSIVFPSKLLPNNVAYGFPGVLSSAISRGAATSAPMLRMSWDGVVSEVVAERPYGRGQMPVKYGMNVILVPQPFVREPIMTISPDGKRFAMVDVRETGTPAIRVTHLSSKGDTVSRFDVPFDPVPVTKPAIDTAMNEVRARFRTTRLDSAIRAVMTIPKFLPPFATALLENDGTVWLWLRSLDATTVRWLVVSPQGKPVATITMPNTVTIVLIDRGIWATSRDKDNVPSVVRYRMK